MNSSVQEVIFNETAMTFALYRPSKSSISAALVASSSTPNPTSLIHNTAPTIYFGKFNVNEGRCSTKLSVLSEEKIQGQ